MLLASSLCLGFLLYRCPFLFRKNGSGPANNAVAALIANRLAFHLPVIPVYRSTQNNASLFLLPRFFSFPKHSHAQLVLERNTIMNA